MGGKGEGWLKNSSQIQKKIYFANFKKLSKYFLCGIEYFLFNNSNVILYFQNAIKKLIVSMKLKKKNKKIKKEEKKIVMQTLKRNLKINLKI